ncbi:hypothetical protein RhiirA5_433681 [Rhizophagus irregularis]|uniref:Uncharacterized protein n=1 Tax=Rhizophagus irregularis TaxID=588596 RepID=A0A2N0NMT0_9GLOM|nr:hypothetical protein RhiirA5_435838 [Rhizophagus irregularis]PKB97130.1 hypothetical protein RhiirA5_433681 [Rhizophagus irregularis]
MEGVEYTGPGLPHDATTETSDNASTVDMTEENQNSSMTRRSNPNRSARSTQSTDEDVIDLQGQVDVRPNDILQRIYDLYYESERAEYSFDCIYKSFFDSERPSKIDIGRFYRN